MNKCQWDGNKCSGVLANPTVEWFFDHGAWCGDTLGVCRVKNMPKDDCGDKCKEENQKYDKIVLSYTPEAPTKKIPKGYFCFFDIDV